MSTIQQKARHGSKSRAKHSYLARVRNVLAGFGRLCLPAARGVYHPQPHSRIILGVAVPPGADLDLLSQQLWWRGLGLVQRSGHVIAGADVSTAVEQRRARQARWFVTQQLRNAGVRGSVKRWE